MCIRDSLLGTKQIHQAVIQLLGKKSLEEFVISLKSELLKTLSVDCIYILLEKPDGSVDSLLPTNCGPNIQTVMQGFVKTYITQGGLTELSKVKLRKATSVTNQLFEDASVKIESEACVQLNLDENQIIGMITFGSSDTDFFEPGQGTDLLKFFASACEKMLERWIT